MEEKTLGEMSTGELKRLIRISIKDAIEDELEDILALLSPEYIKSIEEARKDFKEGRVTHIDDI